ncbi:mucin-5AC-like [Bicyclus anynana]|uniref:Lysozyme n=1 Tax=Bicyclus anynana TaxID=110368 RepID=A0A6J1MPK4_BICAN|nr:mucin-5AC-like [Bicyclus anynana]
MFRVALLVSALAALGGARVFERCALARELRRLGVRREDIATWVCIAYHESRFDTAAHNRGSGDHGILQISELYWCGPGKACGAPCSAFRDDDIADDVRCALQVHKEHTRLQGDGFLAWVVYPHNCKQNAKKYVVDCDINVKDLPIKFEDRARYLKADTKNESKTPPINIPHRNLSTPSYLGINSIFQGSYVNEFERNYYDNNKRSNWLNFKVDNIDELELPGATRRANQRARLLEFSTRPTTTTTLDPDLVGIKPPSPRKIESNQFRRRKTFAEPLFLRNKISDYQKTSKTTTAPATSTTAPTDSSLYEDLSHNIFLNLSPAFPKDVSEFSPKKIISSDLSKYHIQTPQFEEISTSEKLTYDDLAQNPFLNSLLGFSFKSRTESPSQQTEYNRNTFREFTLTTSKPESTLRSFKQIGMFGSPDVNSNLPKESSSQNNDDIDTKVSIEDLSQNPFLSHILRSDKIKPSTRSPTKGSVDNSENYEINFRFTTPKPTSASLISSAQQLDTFTTTRPSSQRGRARYLLDFDKTTERSTVTYSTRKYQTISRQRLYENSVKSTTAITPSTKKPEVSTTSYINNTNEIAIITTTSKTTTIPSEMYNAKETNKLPARFVKTPIPQNASMSTTEVSRTPDIGNTTKISTLQSSDKVTTNKPQTTSKPRTTSTSSTMLQSRTSNRFWEGHRNFTVTPKPNLTVRPTNSTLTSTIYTTTQKPALTTSTEASTTKTALSTSIFDLYLRPSTKPPFKPFEFTSSNRRAYKLSIFSGGTTKPPPSYFTTKKPIIELPKNYTQK